MSKVIYDENGKIDESKLIFKQIRVLNSVHKAIILEMYRKIIKYNNSPRIQARYTHWCRK